MVLPGAAAIDASPLLPRKPRRVSLVRFASRLRIVQNVVVQCTIGNPATGAVKYGIVVPRRLPT